MINKRTISFLFLISIIISNLFSQSDSLKYPLEISISLSMPKSKLVLKGDVLENPNGDQAFDGLNFEVNFQSYFNKRFGFRSSIGFVSVTHHLSSQLIVGKNDPQRVFFLTNLNNQKVYLGFAPSFLLFEKKKFFISAYTGVDIGVDVNNNFNLFNVKASATLDPHFGFEPGLEFKFSKKNLGFVINPSFMFWQGNKIIDNFYPTFQYTNYQLRIGVIYKS